MDEVLARSGIFQGVDPEAAEALAKDMEIIDVRKGDVVFNEGEPGDSLYIVMSWQDQARPTRGRRPAEPDRADRARPTCSASCRCSTRVRAPPPRPR